jgi:hypothetical protein
MLDLLLLLLACTAPGDGGFPAPLFPPAAQVTVAGYADFLEHAVSNGEVLVEDGGLDGLDGLDGQLWLGSLAGDCVMPRQACAAPPHHGGPHAC